MTDSNKDMINLFNSYMKLTNVPHLEDDEADDIRFAGKRLGLVNGSTWIQLWSYYFGRKYLPGVKLVNIGNEAIQLNFMQAYRDENPCPPQSNVELFAAYATQLIELASVDMIMITCSTMNRSLEYVKAAVNQYSIPVLQIDQPMMERAVEKKGCVLIVATHGPTVKSTTNLLKEQAQLSGMNESISYEGATVEKAFEALGSGDIELHNLIIADAIRECMSKKIINRVVLAQLSMSVFKLSYPDPVKEFGVPVLTSGEEGFIKAADMLKYI